MIFSLDSLSRNREPILAGVIVLAPALLLFLLPEVFLPFLVSFLLAYALMPVVRRLERLVGRAVRRRRDFRSYAVTLLYLGGFVLGLTVLVPALLGLLAQLEDLGELLHGDGATAYRTRAAAFLEMLRSTARDIPYLDQAVAALQKNEARVLDVLGDVLKQMSQTLAAGLKSSGRSLLGGISHAASYALVPVLLFYMLMDWERVVKAFFLLLPETYHPWTRSTLARIDRTLKDFLRGQLAVCAIFGLVMTLGLLVLRIPHAVVLGPLAGIGNLVPYLGVVIGLVPAILFTFLGFGWSQRSLLALAGIALLHIGVNALDALVLQPRITAKLVRLHPLVIMLALVLGGRVAGFYGLVLAVPAVAVLRVFFEDGYERLYGRPWALK